MGETGKEYIEGFYKFKFSFKTEFRFQLRFQKRVW